MGPPLRVREDWRVFEKTHSFRNPVRKTTFKSEISFHYFVFLYHSTMPPSAFSSQESFICLSLQFSERSFSKAYDIQDNWNCLDKSRVQCRKQETGCFIFKFSILINILDILYNICA